MAASDGKCSEEKADSIEEHADFDDGDLISLLEGQDIPAPRLAQALQLLRQRLGSPRGPVPNKPGSTTVSLPEPSSCDQNVDAVIAIADIDAAVSHVGFALTDVSAVLSGGSRACLGQGLQEWSRQGGCNAFGERVVVRQFQTRTGVGDIISGMLTSGFLTTTFAPLASLPFLHKSLLALAGSQLPAVFHIAARAIEDDLTVASGYDRYSSALTTGASALLSVTPQEAHDLAIVAHLAALRSLSTVLHLADAATAGTVEDAVSLLRYHELRDLVDVARLRHFNTHPGSADSAPVASAEFFSQVMEGLASVTGRACRPFAYEGHPAPEHLIIALGAEARMTARAVGRVARTSGARIGLLRVVLLRPWSTKALLSAVPPSVRHIVVLTVSALNRPSQLYLDVDGSMRETGGAPTVREIRLDPSAEYDLAEASRVCASCFPDGQLIASPVSPPSHCIALWGLGDDAMYRLARQSLRVFAAMDASARVTGAYRSGSCRDGAVMAATLLFSDVNPAGESELYPGEEDVVLISHLCLATMYDLFARLRYGATVIINVGANDEIAGDGENGVNVAAILDGLSSEDKRIIARRAARVFVLNSEEVARQSGLASCGPLALQAALFQAQGVKPFHTVAPILESTQRASVALCDQHLLVKLHYLTRKSMQQVPIPSHWAGLSVASVPGAARLSLPRETILLFNRDKARAASEAQSLIGIGPTQLKPAGRTEVGRLLAPAPMTPEQAYARECRKRAEMSLAFPTEFKAIRKPRPTEDGIFVGKVTKNVRLTPLDYDRNIFHMEIDIHGTGLRYEIGSALGVYGRNDEQDTLAFIARYGIDPQSLVMTEVEANPGRSSLVQTVYQLFKTDLDLFGRPNKDFYANLAPHAKSPQEAEQLRHLSSDMGTASFKAKEAEAVTFADVLLEFPSARPSARDLMALIPRIKPRHYSIASSMKAEPDSVHLLVVEVDWFTPSGRKRHGQCSRYLANLRPDDEVVISVLPSEMHLPADPKAPVVMAGLGTGMAPFRAFIQEREYLRSHGTEVGPMLLYFGSRHKSKEYLYGDELERAAGSGLLSHLRLAFSRDGPQKVYIQHLMTVDAAVLFEMLQTREGSFYLCGPTWPEPDVEEAITNSFAHHGSMPVSEASEKIRQMKKSKRYVLEVY